MWQPNKITLSKEMLAAIHNDPKLTNLRERLNLLQSKNTPKRNKLIDGTTSLQYDNSFSSNVYLVETHIRYRENLIIDAYNRQS